MGCRSDHLEPTTQEDEARRVAHLTRIMCALIRESRQDPDLQDPPHLLPAAKHIYANGENVHTLTADLCEMLRSASPETLLLVKEDTRPDVVSLREWWYHHLKVDRERLSPTKESRFARLSKFTEDP